MRMASWLTLFLAFYFSPLHAAERVRRDHIHVSLLAPSSFAQSGGEGNYLAVHFEPDPGWHVYWKNAGDSGAAPKFKVQAQGATVLAPLWPAPDRLPLGDLTNLGYKGDVLIPLPVEVSASQVKIDAKLEWLVCKEDCVPGFANFTLQRSAQNTKAEWTHAEAALLNGFLQKVPHTAAQSPWNLSVTAMNEATLQLRAQSRDEASPAPELFPTQGGFLLPARPQVEKIASAYVYTFERVSAGKVPASLGLVLRDGATSWEHSDIALPRPAAPTAQSLWLLLFLAFLGGVILNLMPCVFPVLSIKVFSLLRTGNDSHLKEGLAYAAGVLTTFAALGAALLLLRGAGASLGWGFQLQSPYVVLGLILLFWLMALDFLGALNWGQGIMNFAGQQKAGSSFSTGVLAVFVAAPCTGPFMGSALGAAVTLPWLQAIGIFLSLGAGLAAPFVVLSASPRLVNRLPKPGAWMERLKELLAFPLLATVLWLLWVLAKQSGESAWVIGGSVLLMIAFAAWLLRHWQSRGAKILIYALALAHIVVAFRLIETKKNGAPTSSAWRSYNAAEILAARSAGQAVFIDFTAAWCITCQWNKKSVLDTESMAQLFADKNVFLVRADWTNQDPAITQALAAFGRNSVPLYVFYGSGKSDAKILPQILSKAMIEDLFSVK